MAVQHETNAETEIQGNGSSWVWRYGVAGWAGSRLKPYFSSAQVGMVLRVILPKFARRRVESASGIARLRKSSAGFFVRW